MTRRELIAALLAGPFVLSRADRAQEAPRAVTPAQLDITTLTVAQAIAQLAARTITPLQLTDAYLDRIATMNPSLNAFITVTADHARSQARRTFPNRSEPVRTVPNLFGIPIAHKDLIETAGVRTTAGSRLFDEHIPRTNAAIVQQLERAGAVLLGKTNTHELGGGVTTINPFYGTTRNPIDLTRIPGGSSGGSAAAVTARMCAAATGSDTGGSVRIPAAFCGCVGFKPTYGLISTAGLLGSCPTFDHIGFLTRTVEDAELMFNAVSDVRRAGALAPAGSGYRIGVAKAFFFDELGSDVASSVDAAIASIRARGHHVEDVRFPIDAKTMERVFDPIVVFEIWSRFGADWRATPSLFSESFAEFFKSERPTVTAYESAQAALKAYQAEVDRLFDRVDVILTPTVPITAPRIAGPIDGAKILRNTWPLNAAGTPAISIPCRRGPLSAVANAKADGTLPVGLQLIAKRGNDDLLLRAARMIAEALP
jgi:aspartyl-tRNA(Asn)/glutamyl-tRNA(Gln) amidotransferase subunit A